MFVTKKQHNDLAKRYDEIEYRNVQMYELLKSQISLLEVLKKQTQENNNLISHTCDEMITTTKNMLGRLSGENIRGHY